MIAPAERADDQVEGIAHAQPLQRRDHAGRHDAAHAAALEHERDAVDVLARAGHRAGIGTLAQDSRDGMGRRGELRTSPLTVTQARHSHRPVERWYVPGA